MTILSALLIPAGAAAGKTAAADFLLELGDTGTLDFAALFAKQLPEQTDPALAEKKDEPKKTAKRDEPAPASLPEAQVDPLPFMQPMPALEPKKPEPKAEKPADKAIDKNLPVQPKADTQAPAAAVAPLAPEAMQAPDKAALPPPAQIELPAVQQPSAQQVEATPAARHVTSIAAPVNQPAWGHEVATKVTWLATQRVQSAELHVQPPELGPVQISIRMESNEASLTLAAPHGDTRHALEAALPELREMLEARGIELADASVGASDAGAGSFREPGPDYRAFSGHAFSGKPDTPGTEADPVPAAPRSLALVDVFA